MVCGTSLLRQQIVLKGLWNFNSPQSKAVDVCEIVGTKGTVSFSVFGPQWLHLTVNGKSETQTFSPPEHVQQPMIEAVVAYFRNEGENPCSVEEGLQVMQWLDSFTIK